MNNSLTGKFEIMQNRPWFQKPVFGKTLVDFVPQDQTADVLLQLGKNHLGVGQETMKRTNASSNMTNKFKVRHKRCSNACTEHKRKHQRCAPDCIGRKKEELYKGNRISSSNIPKCTFHSTTQEKKDIKIPSTKGVVPSTYVESLPTRTTFIDRTQLEEHIITPLTEEPDSAGLTGLISKFIHYDGPRHNFSLPKPVGFSQHSVHSLLSSA